MRTDAGRHRGPAAVLTAVLALAGATSLGVVAFDRVDDQTVRLSVPGATGRATPSDGRAGSEDTEPSGAGDPSVVGPVMDASAPRTLEIPAIGVRSDLQRLGLAADGTMAVPLPGPRYDDAGWYRHSPTPGSLGPAVIVGHVDSAENGPSVFYRLGSLRRDDTVRVTRADGSVAVFAVDSVRQFRKSRFPTQLVYGNTDHAALRLITCGGPITASGHYRDNIIVLASLV